MIESTLPRQKLLVKCPLLGDKKGWMKAFDEALASQKTLRYRNGLQCSSIHVSDTTSTPSSSENGWLYDLKEGKSSEIKVNRQCSILEGLKRDQSDDDFFDNVLDDFDKIMAKYS